MAKTVKYCRSYDKKNVGVFFMTHSEYMLAPKLSPQSRDVIFHSLITETDEITQPTFITASQQRDQQQKRVSERHVHVLCKSQSLVQLSYATRTRSEDTGSCPGRLRI